VSGARRVPLGARGEPEWELLVHTRQFSYPSTSLGTSEWPATAGRQAKDLRDTENGRVRKRLNKKDLESRNGGSKGIAIAEEEGT